MHMEERPFLQVLNKDTYEYIYIKSANITKSHVSCVINHYIKTLHLQKLCVVTQHRIHNW